MGVSPKDGCVIAAPSSFTAEQREALKKAAEDAGIKVLQIIDESAAVLVGYRAGLVKERQEVGYVSKGEEEKADKTVVVVDVGETGVEVEVVAVREGSYIHLGGGRDESVGGRELDKVVSSSIHLAVSPSYLGFTTRADSKPSFRSPFPSQLISHFAKEFTKKTKVALPLPITASSSTNEADLRAQTKLLLAIEHTKRSLSASTGAATCAVESLKEGMDLSASINRMRFDGLAGNVYRKIGAQIKKVVEECGLNLVQVDEVSSLSSLMEEEVGTISDGFSSLAFLSPLVEQVLLAGSSSLLPGLHSSISYLFPESTPVSSSLNPSEAIAIGCALQALHLAQLPSSPLGAIPVADYLSAPTSVITTSKPIGLVLAGGNPESDFVTLVAADTPLPARRTVAVPVAAGVTGSIGLELWEGESSIKIDTIAPPSPDEDESEEDEPEEVASVVLKGKTYLTGVKVDVKSKKDAQVILEVTVAEGKVELKAWEHGSDQKVSASA
jgi:heat shock protein 1/8